MRHEKRLVLGASGVLSLLASGAIAASLTVPGDYLTIQAAVNAASSGDEIVIGDGTYLENITITTGITLQAAVSNNPVIDGAVLIWTNSGVTLDGLEIHDGSMMYGSTTGGVIVAGSGHTVRNCTLIGDGTSQYYGIHVAAGPWNNLVIEDNEIHGWFGGMYLNPSSGHVISGNNIHDNAVGIGSDGISGVVIHDNIFSDNSLEGMGISAAGAGVDLHDNQFLNNGVSFAHYGGATVDASPNWWGDIYPGDDVSGDVDYYPCYNSQLMNAFFPVALAVDGDWNAFVIRENSTQGPPQFWGNNVYLSHPTAVEFSIFAPNQKAGLGTDLINGARVDQIATLHIDRLDDYLNSSSLYGPYFNIWVTDGLGHYAVIANEPSNPEWASNRWDVADWDYLKTKTCKVYETPGAGTDASWVHAITGPGPLTFEDVAMLIIEPPSAAYISNPANGVGSGAPDVLGTNEAFGFNWIFGDTAANYVTGTGEGFVVDGYTATANFPVHNVTQDTYFGSIQPAINAASANDVIEVSAGIYNEGLVIDRSLTLLGPNAALSPNTDTRVSEAVIAPLGTTHAIQGVAPGIMVTIKGMWFDLSGADNNYRFVNVNNQANNTWTFEHNRFDNAPDCINGNWYLTGSLVDLYFNLLDNRFTGSIVSNGIALWGNGVNHVDIRDNVFIDNQGWALNLNNVHGTIESNLFTDQVDNGSLWYEDQSGIIVASANNDLLLSDNIFSNMASLGLSIYNGFDGALTGTGNQFLDCESAGIRVRAATPVADLADVHFSGNVFSGNTYGIENTMGGTLDAVGNWWGHGSGPLDASDDTGSGGLYNPSGLGDAVTDGIDYDPWITTILDGTQVASSSLISVDNAGCPATTTVTFGITADMVVPEYFGYTFHISYPAGLVPTGYSNNYTPGGTQGLTLATGLNTAGPLVVDWVLFGNTAFTTQTGNLFTVTFDGVADDPAAAITVTLAQFRQHVGAGFINLDVEAPAPSVIVVDGTNPVLLSASFPGDPCINTDFSVTVSGSDNQGLERVQYRFDNAGAWTDVITGIAGDSHGPVAFNTSGVTLLSQGAHTIHVRYEDDVCNAATEMSWAFNLDTLAPVAPTNLVATPDHGIVHLSWTAGSNYTGYRLYGLVRPGYPYWNDGLPNNVNDGLPGVGAPVANGILLESFLPGDPTTYPDTVLTRGVYDYQLVAYDCAPNTSTYSNIASSTNYFLGDWAASPGGFGVYDGYVCSPDVTFLSGSYGLSTINAPMNEMDIAPTSNNSALGLPGPDHVINFEDLIILAINYRLSCASSPLNDSRELPGLGKDGDVATGGTLRLGHNGETATLELDGQLLGYSALLRTDRRLVSLESAHGLALHYAVDGGYRVDLVSLDGLLDEGSTLTLRFAGEGGLELVSADGRDTNNRGTLLSTSGGQDRNLPTVFSLEQNYPNPFNPGTTLRFALPTDSHVELAVYNTLGQKVSTVVSGNLSAGWHELAFDGSSLASGVYFLSMQAGHFHDLRRMVLVK
jgi:hypothetical protein